MPRSSHPRPPAGAVALNGGAPSRWTNLGLWTAARDYPEAARALAVAVGDAAQLRPSDVVLDLACGYGDSLQLWVEHFGVDRVVGVEPDPAVVHTARSRIAAWGLSGRVSVVAGRAESIELGRVLPSVTAVVCVDAAYHFRGRDWLRRALAALPAGGRIALSELTFGPRAARSWRLRAFARLVGIPRENLIAPQALDAVHDGPGTRVHCDRRVGEAVLDGFVARAPSAGFGVRLTRAMLRLTRHELLVDYRILGTVKDER